MSSSPKHHRLLEKVYPGIIAKLESLGPGKFLDDNPPYRILTWAGESLTAFSVTLKYGFDDGMLVRIVDSLEFLADKECWRSFHHAYHCGPSHIDIKAFYFRIDLDELHSYHVHLQGYMHKGDDPHIPASLLDPDTRNINPLQFLDLVHKYRTTKRLPLRVKKDKK